MTLFTSRTQSRRITPVAGLFLLFVILPISGFADIVQEQTESLLPQEQTMCQMLEILEPVSLLDQMSSNECFVCKAAEADRVPGFETFPGLQSASPIAVPEPGVVVPAILVTLLALLNRRPRRRLTTVA